MNGYFQIVPRNGFAIIKMFPPTDGGEGVKREDIVEYLQLKNIVYEPKDLIFALANQTEEREISTPSKVQFFDGEFVKVNISPDNMLVTMKVFAPFIGGPVMNAEELTRELSTRGIIFGVDQKAIADFVQNRRYCTEIEVAHGKPCVQGTDASIEYFFNTDPKVRPTLNDDGSVDFFHLNTLNHCKKGDMLAKLTPAVPGELGMNVKGERIKPRDIRNAILKYGHNIILSEDKTIIWSDVDGHVTFAEGKVFVSNVLEVENVDTSTGNIEYDGSVRVNGNITENFSVKAAGNIEVRGVVEGAYVEAGQDIIIVRGMNGMHKGVLKAGGNIVSKFLENATATANGYIDCESILHSEVSAGTDIHVTGRKGFISGGRVSATNSISVRNLGSNMGADTIVEVGADMAQKKTRVALEKEMQEINKQLKTINPVLDGAKQKLQSGIKMTQDQILQIQKLAVTSKTLTARLSEIMTQLDSYASDEDDNTKGQVIVTGDVFPGTKICIGDVSMTVKTAMKYCRFIKEKGDVKMAAIY